MFISSGKNNLKSNWIQGNFKDFGLEPAHDRGVFCVDIYKNSVTTGSADHGLRTYDLKTGQLRRELYNKRYGHKEWVTSCAYLNDGRLISAGMDS